MRFYNEKLISFAKNVTEQEYSKRLNVLRIVVDVLKRTGFDCTIRHNDNLAVDCSHHYSLLVEGSFGNETSLGECSDLDIDFIDETFNYDETSNIDYILTLLEAYDRVDKLKKAVFNAFKKARYDVYEGNQCINAVIDNINIDIVPSIRHINKNGEIGISYVDRARGLVNNYPELNIINALNKNKRTSNRYREVVRSLKRIRMMFEQENSSHVISSFCFECLLYNVEDEIFINGDLATAIKECINELSSYDIVIINSLLEINGINRITANPYNTPRRIFEFLQNFIKYINS